MTAMQGLGLTGINSGAEIAIDTRFGEVVVLHERFDAHALGASVPECSNLLRRQLLGPAEVHPTRFGFGDPIHLPFGPELRLKLGDGSQHMEQQAACGIARVDVLIEDFEPRITYVGPRSGAAPGSVLLAHIPVRLRSSGRVIPRVGRRLVCRRPAPYRRATACRIPLSLGQLAEEGCTSEKSALRPSAIVGCARMASRKPV